MTNATTQHVRKHNDENSCSRKLQSILENEDNDDAATWSNGEHDVAFHL